MPSQPSKNALTSRDNIFYAIGSALNEWSGVENALTHLFGGIIENSHIFRLGAAFASVSSFEARVDMVHQATIKTRLPDEYFNAWNSLYQKLRRSNKARNEIVHFTMMYNADDDAYELHPYSDLLKPSGKTPLRYKDITQRVKSFQVLQKRVWNFFEYVNIQRGHSPTSAAPEGDPARLLQNPNARTPSKS